MSPDNEREGGGFFAGFLVGALVGAAVAYAIVQEGTRDAIVGKAREAGNFAMDASGDFRGRVSGAATTFQSSMADLYARGKTVVEGARSNVDAAVEEGRTTAEQVRTDLNRQTQAQSQSQASE